MTEGAEEWRPVVGWEGLYDVSSLGRVRSIDRTVVCKNRWGGSSIRILKGRILKGCVVNGYLGVELSMPGRQKFTLIHILVCRAYHGERPDGMQVAHGNGQGADNRSDNLRWASCAGNNQDKKRHGTQACGEGMYNAKLTEADVLHIRASQESGLSLARSMRVGQAHISRIRRRKVWTHI